MKTEVENTQTTDAVVAPAPKRAKAKVAKKAVKKVAKKKVVAKGKKVAKKVSKFHSLKEDTIFMAMVKFIRRPQGATHAEICKKFGQTPHDERSRFFALRKKYGFPIKKTPLPKDSKREGRKLFTLPQRAKAA